MVTKTGEKRYALAWIDQHAGRFSDFTCASGTTPSRLGANKAYCDLLRAKGFAVEEGSDEMPNMMRRRATRSRSFPIAHPAPGGIPGHSSANRFGK